MINVLYSSDFDTRFSLSAHLFEPEEFRRLPTGDIVGSSNRTLTPAQIELVQQDKYLVMYSEDTLALFVMAIRFGIHNRRRRARP